MSWTDDEAARTAGELLGAAVIDVESVPCSAGNQAFLLRVDGTRLVMKTASHQAVRAEAAVLALLTRHDVPVPEVVASDPHGVIGGRPVLVLGRVAGEALTGPSPTLAEVGSLLRLIHAVELDGFGPLDLSGETLVGMHASWVAALDQRVAGFADAVAAGKADPMLVDRAVDALASVAGGFDPRAQARLLHGDLHPRHVYALDGSVTAIIDWGGALAGDPAFDLARVLHSGAVGGDLERGWDQVDAVLDGWAPGETLSHEARRRLLAYAVIYVAGAMADELQGGSPWPPWWDIQIESLTAILDALDR